MLVCINSISSIISFSSISISSIHSISRIISISSSIPAVRVLVCISINRMDVNLYYK